MVVNSPFAKNDVANKACQLDAPNAWAFVRSRSFETLRTPEAYVACHGPVLGLAGGSCLLSQ